MACRFLGFEASPVTAQEAMAVFACLPSDFRQDIKIVNYRQAQDFNRSFKVLGSGSSRPLAVMTGQAPQKVWTLIGPDTDSKAGELSFASRFTPNMVRQACCLLVDKILPGLNFKNRPANSRLKNDFKHIRSGLVDALFGALTVNISQPDQHEWRGALALRLLAHNHDYTWVDWVLKSGLKALGESEESYAASAYQIRQLQKRIIKRCASAGVKRIIKNKFDQPYQRSLWLNDILADQSVGVGSLSLPGSVAVSLRVLVREGEPAQASSMQHLINTLRVL
ncbi:MAG TPA: hypothetical protein PLF71_03935 [bacterium]|nr:MAG: hypothetical protein BWY14_00859 [Parcubacteria group bacterium ADurb.Bin192]HPN15233.1 hypothetical protein [bacterium]